MADDTTPGFEGEAADAPLRQGIARHPSFGEALAVWARIAVLSFGGPAGQIALMHRVLVEEKRWIGEARFLHALNFCMLLPGPEAQQLATYIGWLMHRTKGGLAAGILFVVPGFLAIMALSLAYVAFGYLPAVEGLFFGLKAAVLAIVLQASLRIGKRALKNRAMVAIAAGAFLSIFVFAMPFPLIVFAAGMIGFAGASLCLPVFLTVRPAAAGQGEFSDEGSALGAGLPDHARPNAAFGLKTGGLLAALWLMPVFALVVFVGRGNVFTEIALFFSQMAVVTFGGAYAVLAYVAQQAVETYGWLKPGEMLDGLGLAETTPGPLIMVLQFVGFLAAYRDPGPFGAVLGGVLGGVLTVWVTFTPCFLWIFVGAPFIERLRSQVEIGAALAAITAAIVGVIVNLAVWFALHVLFRRVEEWHGLFGVRLAVPVPASLDAAALVLCLGALLAVFRFRFGLVATLAVSAGAGVVWRFMG